MSTDSQRTLLIVEDDLALQKQIKWSLDEYVCATAHDRESALTQVRRHVPAVVTMDLGLPPNGDDPSEGFKLLAKILEAEPDTKVIVLTGQNDRSHALKAISLGAYDFFAKPFEPELLKLTIDRAFKVFELQKENRRLRDIQRPDALSGLITGDPEMLRLCRNVERMASSNASIMLLGESGTGKEVVARALHTASPRRNGKFVAINCAAIPENLLESELFGYERGAFTGAAKTTPGRIESAHGGTLMLDEIGDFPMSLQAKLLRFLQERTIERIGGRQEIPVDIRIVCATHQDLLALTKERRFREDLYYRLAEIVIKIPPLRERAGDSALLAHAFVRRYAQEQNRGNLSLSDDAVRAIEASAWPGNVRELASSLKRACIMAEGNQITRADIDLAAPIDAAEATLDLRVARENAERRTIVAALGRVNGNIVKAADLLGVSRPTLYDLMNRLGLK